MEVVEPGIVRNSRKNMFISGGKFNHWEDQRCFMWSRIIGVISVYGIWIKEGHIKSNVDLASNLITSLCG